MLPAQGSFLHPCANYVNRPWYTERLLDYFQPALEEDDRRFLLWGTAGVGKTQIAAHFIANHATTMVKRILHVRADTFESFVCDFIEIYYTLTGQSDRVLAPKTLKGLLNRSKDAMEDCPDDWFLVLDDCHDFERAYGVTENIQLADYLPRRGRTLIISSFTVVAATESGTELYPPLQIEAERLQVREMSDSLAAVMLNKSVAQHLLPEQSPLDRHEFRYLFDGALRKVDCRPLILSKVAAVCQTLQFDLFSYMRLFKAKGRRFRHVVTHENDLGDIPPSLSIALDITLDCVRDLNSLSMEILQYFSLLHCSEIDAEYLWGLPRVASLEDEFTEALDTLVDLSLIQRHKNSKTGSTKLRMHSTVHLWLSAELEMPDRHDYLIPAIHHFGHELRENGDREVFHQLLPHMREIIRQGFTAHLDSQQFLRLLITMSKDLIEVGMYNTAGRLLTQAASIVHNRWPIVHVPDRTTRGVVLLHIKIKHMTSDVAFRLKKFRDAERELKAALSLAESPFFDFSSIFRVSMISRLKEDLANPLHEREKFDEELKIHEELVVTDQTHDTIQHMRRVQNMARCFFRQGNIDGAFKNSYKVLDWIDRYERRADPFCQPWIIFYAQLLVHRCQLREASNIFLLDSVNGYVESLEKDESRYWGAAEYMVRTMYQLHEYQELERMSLRILDCDGRDELEGAAFRSYIYVLRLLSLACQRTGRLLEADIILRHTIERLEADTSGDLLDQLPLCRHDLVKCLCRQKRVSQATEYRNRYAEEIGKVERTKFGRTIKDWLREDEEQLETYLIGLEKLREGATLEDDPFFEESREDLEVAGDRFGLLEDRLREDTDPRTDLDTIGIGAAQRSALLDVLELGDHSTGLMTLKIDDLHTQRTDMKNQKLLTDYFHICKCHRHRTGRYLNDHNFWG